MQEIIAEAKQRPGYVAPLPGQIAFADRIVLLTMTLPDTSLAKVLALGYAESLAAGHLSIPLLDHWAQMLVLRQINRESIEASLGRKLLW